MAEKIDFSKINFLVVDASPLSADIFQDVLTTLGAGPIQRAPDSDEAIGILRQGGVDIMLSEWNIAPLNGLELLDWVRGAPGSPNRLLPVIMVTANSDLDFVVRARDHGVSEFLGKPFSAEQLFNRLVSGIAKPRQFVEAEDYFGPDRRRRRKPYSGSERRRAFA